MPAFNFKQQFVLVVERGHKGAVAQCCFWSETFPALVRRGCPRVARLGRSVQRRTVPINKERCAASITRLRVFEQFLMFRLVGLTLRACPSLLRRGMSTNSALGNSPDRPWLR